MRKVFKWLLIAIGGVIALLALVFALAFLMSEQRLNRQYQVELEPFELEQTQSLVAQGEHLAVIRGCTDCHGGDLGGQTVLEDPMLGTIAASNLTEGEGGVAAAYSDAELARAIRHGVDYQNRGLLIMPSHEYFILSNDDVQSLIAYLRSLPAVDHQVPETQLTLLARALFVAGQLPALSAEVIDHQAAHPPAPDPAASPEYGQYLAASCTGCHGIDFSGGPVPGSAPGSPEAANLTPAGALGGWSEAGFMETLRTGNTPEGKQLDPSNMPWPATAQMTDLELQALWSYLQTVDPVASN